MADFRIAINKVLKREGGYVNDPDDKGGETYMGISRKAHPNNYMWTIIDSYKKRYTNLTTLKSALKKDENLLNYVRRIYKQSYWDKFKLDDCLRQSVAEQIFDDAINRGCAAACKLCCSLLNLPISGTPSDKLFSILSKL